MNYATFEQYKATFFREMSANEHVSNSAIQTSWDIFYPVYRELNRVEAELSKKDAEISALSKKMEKLSGDSSNAITQRDKTIDEQSQRITVLTSDLEAAKNALTHLREKQRRAKHGSAKRH